MAFQAGAVVSQLTLDRSKFSASIKAVKKQTKSLGGWVKKNSAQFKAMGIAATVAGTAVLLVFKKMVKQYVETGDMIHKMAIRTGFAAETLSELAYAADISGADINMLEKGVKKMSKTIVDASYGLETYLRVFRGMGIEIEDIIKLSPEEQFLTLGAAIAAMENQTLKTAAAVDVFGRAGTMLLPLFAEGEEGMAKLREEAHRLGIIFDEEAAAKAAKLKDAQTALKGSIQGVSIAILNDLIPVLTDVTKEFTDFFVTSREDAGSWTNALIGFFKLIAKGVQALMLSFTALQALVFQMGEGVTKVFREYIEKLIIGFGVLEALGVPVKGIMKDLVKAWATLRTVEKGYWAEADKHTDTMADIILGFEKFFAVLDKIKTKTKEGKKEQKDLGEALEKDGTLKARDFHGALEQVVGEFKNLRFYGTEFRISWQETMRQVLAGVTSVVGAMDSLFGQFHANEAMRLDNEEKQKTDAIESWFESERERIERTITDEEELVAALEALDEEKARKENELQHKMDKERRKLEQAKAKSQKASALFSAGINVAEAITKALTAGPLIGQIFAGIVAALGAVQMAAIAAAPLPSLQKGGIVEKEGAYHLHAGEEVKPAPIVMGRMAGASTYYATVNIYPQRLDDHTINRAAEKIHRAINGQRGRY